jgi:protocatechuate 3,4-dioxygenase beta subunit
MRKLAVLLLVALPLLGDSDWIRAWESTQRARPASVGPVARIAPESEKGTPLVIRGRLLKEDGSAAAGVTVFAYHTDDTGVYANSGPAHTWRLRGWAKTDANGRFEFRTIRPGRYPNRREVAHVHFTVEGPGVTRRTIPELQFDGSERLTTRNGVQIVDYEARISSRGSF